MKDKDNRRGHSKVAACTVDPDVLNAIDALARVRMSDRSGWLREAIAAKMIAEGVDLLQLTAGRPE